MTSQASHSHSSLRKKTSQHHHSHHAKSHKFIKQRAFFGESAENDEESEESGRSHADGAGLEQRKRWTAEENALILSGFKDYGADWGRISQHLQSRSEQEAKGHFQKILRKIIQNLNKKLREQGQNQVSFKKIKIAIEATHSQTNFRKEDAEEIKEALTRLALMNGQGFEEEQMQESIVRTNMIMQLLKKNRKKKHSSKASTEINGRDEVECRQIERGYLSDSSSVFEEPKEPTNEQNYIRNIESCYADEQALSQSQPPIKSGVVVEQSQEGIKDLLRLSGVLQIQEGVSKSMVNIPESVASSSQNLNNQSYQHFYEQSELQRDCYWKKSCSELNSLD